MKTKNIAILVIMGAIILSPISAIAAGDHDHEHAVVDHCDTPTKELLIKADSVAIAYTKGEYSVEKDTCYELQFENPAVSTEHDVNIDAVDDGDVQMDKVHIHVANMTDGESGVRSMHIMTPDADTELEIYCSVDNHRGQGMEAILVVGRGNRLPFNGFYVIISMFMMGTVVRINRRK